MVWTGQEHLEEMEECGNKRRDILFEVSSIPTDC